MRTTLQRRLSLAFVGLAVIPLLLASGINGYLFYRHNLDTEAAHVRELSLRVASDTEAVLRQGEQALARLLQYQDFLGLAPGVQQARLLELLHREPGFRELALIGADGRERIRVSTQALSQIGPGRDRSGKSGFQTAMRSGAVHFGRVYQDAAGEPLMHLYLPVTDLRSGQVAAVLAAEFRLQALWDTIAALRLDPGGDVYIIGRHGQVIAHRNPSVVLRGTPFSPVADVLVQPGLSGEPALLAASPVRLGQENILVVAERQWRYALQPALDGLVIVGGVLLLALAVAWGAVGFSLRRIVQPILEVEDTARDIAGGDLNRRVPARSDDEIGALARSFNAMTDHLQRTLGQLQGEIMVRERAEAEVREAEARYRLLVENQNDLLVKFDPAGRLLFVSPTYCQTFGKSEAALLGQSFMPFIHVEDRERVQASIDTLFHPPYVTGHEERALTTQGWRWLAWSNRAVVDERGEVREIIAVGRDITQRKEAEEKVRRARQMLDAVINTLPMFVFWKDRESRFLGCNERFAKSAGLASVEEIVGKTDRDLVWHAQAELYREDDARVMSSGLGKYQYVEPQTTASGETIWLETSKVPLRDAEGAVVGVIGMYQDVTERIQAEKAQRQAAAVFENTQEGIIITDANGVIQTVNPAFTEITGYTPEEAVGQTPRLLRSGRHDDAFYQRMWLSIRMFGGWQGEIWNRRKDGEIYPEWESIGAIKDAEGKIIQYIAVFSDISQLKSAQEDIQRLAHYDALTNLPNRLLMRARLEHAMERANREGTLVGLLFMDLDRFKHVNDSLGHSIGDALLVDVANRIREQLRREDTVARLGGDEFTIVLEDVHNEEDVARLAAKLNRELAEPFHIRGHELFIGSSIGISLYPRDGRTVETLLSNADAAMYRAKEAGRGNYQFYTQEMTAQVLERLLMEGQLRRALEQDELLLHYQPQVDLRSGDMIGMEVLVRWLHPEQGLVSPIRFIPVAEESGLIVPMGEWILRHACQQARAWLDQGIQFGRISVNVAGPQIQRGNIVDVVTRALADSGLPAGYLELEITENFIMNQAERAIAQLHILRDMGVSLAIDDFGTGYSSLAYLKSLPIDKLKIDQGFVRDLPGDENDAAISRAVIALGQNLQFEVIAEGVETEAQREFLLAHGCLMAQGYLYSRPLPAEEIAGWLARRG